MARLSGVICRLAVAVTPVAVTAVVLASRREYVRRVDTIGEKLTAIEKHLDVAGEILGTAGPSTLNLGSDDRIRAFEAVGKAAPLLFPWVMLRRTGPAGRVVVGSGRLGRGGRER